MKPERKIFVIMPFRQANDRTPEQLAAFFEKQIKDPIEKDESFNYRYRVRRSDDRFNITKEIIVDLFYADIVICDLSGKYGNPNVMYELGVRLACSEKPVILIREDRDENESIFDIAGFHVFGYDPYIPTRVTDHIRQKLLAFESEAETFYSPVLEILGGQVPFLRQSKERAKDLVNIFEIGLLLTLRAFGAGINDHLPDGNGLHLVGSEIDYYEELTRKQEELQAVDWSEIKIIVGPHPALIHYLSTNYLNGLVESEAEIAFSVEMMRYHSSYFLEAAWWLRLDFNKALRFARHTQAVMALCRLTGNLLRAVDRQHYQEIRTKFDDLVGWIRGNFG